MMIMYQQYFFVTSNESFQLCTPGGRLNIDTPSYQYRDSHDKDKTVSPTVLSLTWESPYMGKTVFILTRGPDHLFEQGSSCQCQWRNVKGYQEISLPCCNKVTVHSYNTRLQFMVVLLCWRFVTDISIFFRVASLTLGHPYHMIAPVPVKPSWRIWVNGSTNQPNVMK